MASQRPLFMKHFTLINQSLVRDQTRQPPLGILSGSEKWGFDEFWLRESRGNSVLNPSTRSFIESAELRAIPFGTDVDYFLGDVLFSAATERRV